MDIGSIHSNAAMAVAVQILETTSAIQTEMVRQSADSQRQLAAMLQGHGSWAGHRYSCVTLRFKFPDGRSAVPIRKGETASDNLLRSKEDRRGCGGVSRVDDKCSPSVFSPGLFVMVHVKGTFFTVAI